MLRQSASSVPASLLARRVSASASAAAPRSTWAKAPALRVAAACSHGATAGHTCSHSHTHTSPSVLLSAGSPRFASTASPSSASRWLRNRDRPRVVCSGCGVGLQSRDQAAAGYIPTLKQLEELERRADEALALSRRAAAEKSAKAAPASGGAGADEEPGAAAAVSAALSAGLDLRTGTFAGHGIICQRCFQAKHYGRLVPLSLPQDAFVPYIQALQSRGALVIQVVDVFDFHSTASALVNLHKLAAEHGGAASAPSASSSSPSGKAPKVDVLLVVNKVDLLPTDASLQRISSWVREEAARLGLGRVVSPKEDAERKKKEEEAKKKGRKTGGLEVVGTAAASKTNPSAPSLAGVYLVSSKKAYGVRDVVAAVKELKGDRDVYVVGAPNVGKSTLINALLAEVWKLKPSAASSSAAPRALASRTLFLDELPPGYAVGDVFTGDLAALDAAIRARDAGIKKGWEAEAAAGIAPPLDGGAAATAGGRSYIADPAAHLARRMAGSGGSGAEAALLDTTLAEVRAKKASYSTMGKGGAAAAAAAPAATPAPATPSASILSHSNSSKPARDVTAPDFDASDAIRSLSSTVVPAATVVPVSLTGAGTTPSSPAANPAAPWVTASSARRGGAAPLPFTTSPLPGTTLGVVGAPLDPHGHSYLYDTPGVIADPWKQRLLEQLVAGTAGSGEGGSTKAPVASKSAPGLRQLLVPDKRSPFPLIRLRPGRSLFIGGLARVDWVHPDASVGILVHAVTRLPLHLTATHKAEDLFARHALAGGADSSSAHAGGSGEGGHGFAPGGLPLLSPSWGPLQHRGSVPLLRYVPAHVKAAMRAAGVGPDGQAQQRPEPPAARTQASAAAVAVSVAADEHDSDAAGAEAVMLDYGGEDNGRDSDDEEGGAAAAGWRYGGGAAGTEARRRKRVRRALVDIALPGIGWLSFTPIEIEGMYGWWRAVSRGSFSVHTCKGLSPHLRPPLLPHQATGTRPTDWLE